MKLNSVVIDSTNSYTDLCKLGIKYPTDKSPYNTDGILHKHAYTPIYDLLFSYMRYNNIVMGEIGIYRNYSMKCWREYFPNAIIYGYEFDESWLMNAIADNLHNTAYLKIDVKDEISIKNTLGDVKFDILIDDSTHEFNDQINIINNAYKNLKPGGLLIIEDIFIAQNERAYSDAIKCGEYFESMTFIFANHTLKYSPGWDNDKLLVLVRNNIL